MVSDKPGAVEGEGAGAGDPADGSVDRRTRFNNFSKERKVAYYSYRSSLYSHEIQNLNIFTVA